LGTLREEEEEEETMVMQETVKVEDSMGKINISPSKVAFIVDHYLSANNLSQTRATLRMEAPSLFAASPFGKVSINVSLILQFLFSSHPTLPLIWPKYSLIIYL